MRLIEARLVLAQAIIVKRLFDTPVFLGRREPSGVTEIINSNRYRKG
jgi:hypothetical protein